MASKAQGQKSRAAAEAERTARGRRLGLVVFAVALVAMLVVVAVAQGIGDPSVEDGEVAIVEDSPEETITTEDFDRSLAQTAARQGLQEVPAEDDPQYELLRDAAISDLILAAWVLGEAEERGVELSDREIDDELERTKDQQFGSEKAFRRFLDQAGYTADEARERIALQLISDRLEMSVIPREPAVAEEEIEAFYEENQAQFGQPETRDVRVILTEQESEADEALATLERDDSAGSFKKVAQDVSIDEATKRSGGLREGVVQGQSEEALDEQIFAAPEGELVGPFETQAGFYVIQVQAITPAETTPLAEARQQIEQTLAAARQQQIAQAFQEDFAAKWTGRTFCADDFRIDRCSNAETLPDPCTEEVATTQGCDAPVPSTRPVAPGTAGVFGSPAPLGLPQGPVTPAPELPGGLPPGLSPLPGGVPPGAPPATGAPPA
ncbi:MAG: peptidyl-prolyl cis-trans isomerase, partial [Solirubrobacterales bacterium]